MTDWDDAPAALLRLRADGTVVAVSAELIGWTGRSREDLEGVRLSDLLSVGGRIYWETHLSPLLHVEHRLDEVALDLRTPDGRLPVLLTAVADDDGVRAVLAPARHRARFERELVAARAAAESSAARLTALQDATAQLSRAVRVDAVAAALLAAAVGPLGGGAATLWLTDSTGALVQHGGPPAPAPTGSLLEERVATAVDGGVLVPLQGSAALRGALLVTPRTDPGADSLDLELLTALGQQAGTALDRAHLYEHSAGVAHALQQSLLEVEPPDDDRFAVATAYRPGVEALEVGGDFFDVFLADDGVLAVVVGDVVGRGLAAASAMGQLRSAVRAVAGPDVGPGALFARLDRFVEQVEAAGMATLAYAELTLATGELRYACAGHPPPLLLPAGGAPELLWDGRSTPLGAFAVGPREEGVVALSPGDRLLLFTDGLFERRDRSLDDGLALLAQVAGEASAPALADVVDEVTARLLADEVGRDDVCVLLLEWTGQAFRRSLTADLTGLSRVRAELARWLAARGAAERDVADLVLATSEALANAAEHGCGRDAARAVDLRVDLREAPDRRGEVVVRVSDSGTWQPPRPTPERGRGLLIVEALVDDVAVETGQGTTVVLRRRLAAG